MNHTGSEVATSVFNDGADVSADGVLEIKATGFVTELASVVTLANSTADGLNLLDDYMFSTPNSSGLIIIGMNVTRTQNGFETGSLTMRLRPLVPTGTPDVVPD